MGAKNASDEKTVREAGLKGCQLAQIIELHLPSCVPYKEVSARPQCFVVGYGGCVGVPVFILPVLDQQGASPGGRRACRKEWAQRVSVHEARWRQPCQGGEGGCQIVI